MVCLSAYHISRHDKIRGSHLKPQSSGYNVSSDNFKIIKKPMFCDVQSLYFLPDQGLETGLTGVIVGLTGLTGVIVGLISVIYTRYVYSRNSQDVCATTAPMSPIIHG
jgi:hypothetical protein